jgi:hypothetical protein
MKEQGIIDLGDLRVMPYVASPENCINSIQDFLKLDTRINRGLAYYNLQSFLIKIHDMLLKHDELNKLFPFTAISGIMSKCVLLRSDIASGWSPAFDEEFLYFFSMIFSCSLYDPEFERKTQHSDDDFASLFLRKIGSQVRWNIQHHNMWGRTFYIYGELIEKNGTPDLIRDIVTTKFEEKFHLSIIDFIKLGFIVFCGSQQPGCMNREYLEIARRQRISIPDDNTILTFLGHISVDPLTFRKMCANNASHEDHLKTYEFNPLFMYPLIRFSYNDDKKLARYDDFIAPVPLLLTYRFTTGLYYQLFNAFGKNEFSDSFGLHFEHYVEDLLKWYHLPGKIVPEGDIRSIIPSQKKGQHIAIPDWIIFCEEGIILLECKATKYSQEIYEHGLNASESAKGCIRQLNKGINQLKSFEQYIPKIMQAYSIANKNLPIQKVIVTFEPLVALNEGPLRKWMNIEQGDKKDCKIIWVWYLEEIQPYIAKGASLWSFLIDFSKLEFDEIIKRMQSKTGACYSDSVLCKYEDKFYDELLRDTK